MHPVIDAPHPHFAQAGGRFALRAISAVVLLGFVALPARASAQEVVTPGPGGSYPVGTYVTGECSPEDPLPPAPPGDVEGGDEPVYESRSYTYTSFFQLSEDPFKEPGPTPLYPEESILPSDGTQANDPGNEQHSDGPCRGDETTAPGGQISGVPVVQPLLGLWESIAYRQRLRYWCCTAVEPGAWHDDPEFSEGPEIIGTPFEFKVYDPCHFKVKKVKGHAVAMTVGSSKTHQLSEGDAIGGGEIIVRGGGQLVVEGGDGVVGTVGPGTYSLTTRANCKRLRAPLPKTTPPIKIEEGSIFQKATSEFESIIESAKGLFNDGIFSNLRRGRELRQGDGQIAYRVTRDAKHKRTKSCAIKGSLRVYTTSRDVPRAKREVVLNAGQCAVTRDGGAPKVAR